MGRKKIKHVLSDVLYEIKKQSAKKSKVVPFNRLKPCKVPGEQSGQNKEQYTKNESHPSGQEETRTENEPNSSSKNEQHQFNEGESEQELEAGAGNDDVARNSKQ